MNMIKMLWCRFQQCLPTSAMLLVEGSSEKEHFRHLSNNVFGVCNFQNTKTMQVIFFPKCLEFNLDFKNAARNWEKVFCLRENCIWIVVVKFSLLRTGYFSSAANVLRSSPKILHVNKRDFLQLTQLGRDQWIRWKCYDADFNSAWARLPFCLSKSPLKLDVLDIYLTTFSESVISEVQKVWGSSFFQNI